MIILKSYTESFAGLLLRMGIYAYTILGLGKHKAQHYSAIYYFQQGVKE